MLLRGGWILEEDGTTSRVADVLVRDGLIIAIEDSIAADGEESIDCSGSTVMPGLIDVHVHLTMANDGDALANARELLSIGVTTARDVGGPADRVLAARETCAADPSAGPQMFVSCEALADVDGHGTEFPAVKIAYEVDDPEAARAAVRRHKELGADWIKVMLNGANMETELGAERLAAIVEEGKAQGIRIAAHASNPKAVALAVEGGVDSIEHGNGITEAQAAHMAATGMAMVATTYILRAGAGCAHSHGIDMLDAFEPEARKNVEKILKNRIDDHLRSVPAARDAGVLICLGTDSVIGPIGRAVDELESLVATGLTPSHALQAGTVNGAKLLQLDDRGRVAVGLKADLLVVPGRPDQDITCVGQPTHVMRSGRLVSL